MSNNHKMVLAVAAGLLLGASVPVMAQPAAPAAAPLVAVDAGGIDKMIEAVAAYKLGDTRKPLEQLGAQVTSAQMAPAQRALLAAKLAGLASNAAASYDARDFAFRQLYLIATPAEVPALAKFLPDEQFSHMARYVLERIAGPVADEALRQALSVAKGRVLLGIINSVGERADAQAVPALSAMLGGGDAPIAAAAASAMGKIGGADALKALLSQKNAANAEVKAAAVDGTLRIADDLLKAGKKADALTIYQDLRSDTQPVRVQVAALRGLTLADPAKALPLLIDALKGSDPTTQAMAGAFTRLLPADDAKSLTAVLPSLNPIGQMHLVNALAARKDASAKPAVAALLKSADDDVRLAAIAAMGDLGDASDVLNLADLAAKCKVVAERDAIRQSLARVRGAGVDGAIVTGLANAAADVKVELIRALASRRASDVSVTLLTVAAKDDDQAVRIASLNALGGLATDKDIPALVERVASAQGGPEREAARAAVATISGRLSDPDVASAPLIAALANAQPASKVALVSTLSGIGGGKALEAVRNAMKDADPAVQEAATRSITEWPDAAATADMLTLVQSTNQTYKVLALRGLVRVAAAPGKRNAAQTLGIYKQMMDVCTRPEDKKIVLAGLADVKDAGALKLVLPCLDDAALANEAAAATIRIAKGVGAARPAAKAALQKIATAKVSDNLKKQAEAALAGK